MESKSTLSNAKTVIANKCFIESDGDSPVLSSSGKVRPAILLWALGTPVSLVLLFVVVRGCVG